MLDGSERLRGIAFDHRLEIAIHGDEHHFYSPQLVVRVTATDDGGSRLEARFGPDPYVWAFYLLGSGALLLLTTFATMLGIGQWWIGLSPTGLYVAPAAAVLAGLVYGASFVGQGLASDQLYFLRSALTDAVDGLESE